MCGGGGLCFNNTNPSRPPFLLLLSLSLLGLSGSLPPSLLLPSRNLSCEWYAIGVQCNYLRCELRPRPALGQYTNLRTFSHVDHDARFDGDEVYVAMPPPPPIGGHFVLLSWA